MADAPGDRPFDPEERPQPTRVVAIRHGETAWNVDSRIQGQLDVPLNDCGVWQARRLAEALVGEGIDILYASDLQRATQTARAVASRLGLAVQTDAGLRERAFGVFEGLTHAEIQQRFAREYTRWRRRDPDFGAAAGGETLAGFDARCVAVATRLAAAHPGRTIALVAHGGVLDCLYRAALRIVLDAPRTWPIANASINRLLYSPDGFMLFGWGDVSHLEPDALDAVVDDGRASCLRDAGPLSPDV